MSAHTKGPWRYEPKLTASENHKGFVVFAGKGYGDRIADVFPRDEDGKEGEANVRLIAAVPTMIAMLLQIHAIEEGPGETDRPHMVALRTLLRELGELA